MKIGIIDYKYCSLLPIYHSIKSFNVGVDIIDKPNQLKNYDKIVLPGVGATNRIINYLKENKFIDEIHNFAENKKSILGICAGMQIMAKNLYENQKCQGLGFFNADVVSITNGISRISTNIGWVNTKINNKELAYYYCHSFYMNFEDKKDKCIKGTISLGSQVPTIIKKKNILGVQFHPEKSQSNGRNLISDFIYEKL